MTKLRVLDLFSGIGGFSLGLERTQGFVTVAFCEIEPFCQRVLAKHWPGVFIHDDVRTLNKDTLCKGYAENALLNQLCRETGGSRASVSSAITHIKKREGQKERPATTNGPWSAEEALSTIMAGNVPAAENANTHFWQSITLLITEVMRGQNTRELCGSSLSSADFLTTIKYFVTIATQRKQSTVPAHIRDLLKVPIYDDVRELTGARLAADGIAVDVICGGFPCQDISIAGRGAGVDGERSRLWREYARIISELRPRYAIMENSPALLARGAGKIIGELAALGYDAEWHCIPAAAVGATHLRDRFWLVAYPDKELLRDQSGRRCGPGGQGAAIIRDDGQARPMAHSNKGHGVRRNGALQMGWGASASETIDAYFEGRIEWPAEPGVGRVVHGVSDRVDRCGALGNAVVPQVVELIGKAILEAEGAQ